MLTHEQIHELTGILDKMVDEDRTLAVQWNNCAASTAPEKMLCIEATVLIRDLKKGSDMIQLSDSVMSNALNKVTQDEYRIGGITTTLFNDRLLWDCYVHFDN